MIDVSLCYNYLDVCSFELHTVLANKMVIFLHKLQCVSRWFQQENNRNIFRFIGIYIGY